MARHKTTTLNLATQMKFIFLTRQSKGNRREIRDKIHYHIPKLTVEDFFFNKDISKKSGKKIFSERTVRKFSFYFFLNA